MAKLEEWKTHLKQLIAESMFEPLFCELFEVLDNKEFKDDYVLLKFQYNKIHERELEKVDVQNQLEIEYADLSNRLIKFINEIKSDDINFHKKSPVNSLEYFTSLLDKYEALEMVGSKNDVFLLKAINSGTGIKVMLRLETKSGEREIVQVPHTNLINTLSYFEVKGYRCIEMEYINGIRLHDLLRMGVLPPRTCIRIISQLCLVFDYLLRPYKLYRPNLLNPAKIIIDNSFNVKISLFEVFNDTRMNPLYPKPLRKLLHCSPEYLTKPLTDDFNHAKHIQFVLGKFLYKLLTGKRLIEGDTIMALMENWKGYINNPNLNQTVIYERLVPDELNEIMLKVLNPDPTKRYRTLEEMKEALDGALQSRQIKDKVVDDVCESYLRSCKNNPNLLSDFYRKFFQNYPDNDYKDRFKHMTTVAVEKKVRVVMLQMLYLRNKDTSLFPDITSYPDHKGLKLEDYQNYLHTLMDIVKENNDIWSDEIECSWKEAFKGFENKIQTLS